MKDENVLEYILEIMHKIMRQYIAEGHYQAAKTTIDVITEFEHELKLIKAAKDAKQDAAMESAIQ